MKYRGIELEQKYRIEIKQYLIDFAYLLYAKKYGWYPDEDDFESGNNCMNLKIHFELADGTEIVRVCLDVDNIYFQDEEHNDYELNDMGIDELLDALNNLQGNCEHFTDKTPVEHRDKELDNFNTKMTFYK